MKNKILTLKSADSAPVTLLNEGYCVSVVLIYIVIQTQPLIRFLVVKRELPSVCTD